MRVSSLSARSFSTWPPKPDALALLVHQRCVSCTNGVFWSIWYTRGVIPVPTCVLVHMVHMRHIPCTNCEHSTFDTQFAHPKVIGNHAWCAEPQGALYYVWLNSQSHSLSLADTVILRFLLQLTIVWCWRDNVLWLPMVKNGQFTSPLQKVRLFLS